MEKEQLELVGTVRYALSRSVGSSNKVTSMLPEVADFSAE